MKNLLALLGLYLVAFYCMAGPVSEKNAATVAHNFVTEKMVFNNKIRPSLILQETKIEGETAVFYRYNISEKGFIIIAASDLVVPILAYSFDENFVTHPGTQYILQDYSLQIEALEKSKADQDDKIAQLWKHYLAIDFVPNDNKGTVLKPLIHTRWNQNKFYNTYCPWDKNAGSYYDYRVPNGCVALAAAQLMFYYRHPETGTGGVSYVPTPYPRQTVQFNRAHYEWDAMVNMPQTYTNEIAEIIYHVGVASEMGYTSDGSGTYTQLAAQRLNENFKYGNMYTQICRGNEQGDNSSYATLLRDYLDGLHPILYSGATSASGGGHAFLLDGYDDNGLFHVNWGWGGSSDGYYHIDYLAPGGSGLGFDNYSCAMLNVQPNLAYYNIGCSGFKRQTGTSGSISSGAPFMNYAPQPDCSWMIAAPYANQYQFTFNKIHTTPNADVVTIYNGPSENSGIAAQFSGDTIPANPIVINADSVLITFRGTAATNSQYKGFSIDYITTSNTPRCQSAYPSNTDAYTIYSPEIIDGKYLPDMNCTWQLRPQYTKGFNFVFYKFDLAEGDFVEIYNATTTPPTLYKRFDINETPSGIYTVNFNKANIKFVSDNYKEKSGFELLEEAILDIEDDIINHIRIYPNPATHELQIINYTFQNGDQVDIYNILGQRKLSTANGSIDLTHHSIIDVSTLTSGLYLLQITTQNGKVIKKITIQ